MDGRNAYGARVSLLNEPTADSSSSSRLRTSFGSRQEKAGPGRGRPTSLAHYHHAYSHPSAAHSSPSSSHPAGLSIHPHPNPPPSQSQSQSHSHSLHALFHHSHSHSLSHSHSRTSSFASTPVLSSPPTPQLVRSDSSDSAASRSLNNLPGLILSRSNSASNMNLDLTDLSSLGLNGLERTPSPITPSALDFSIASAPHVPTSPDDKLDLSSSSNTAAIAQPVSYSTHPSMAFYPTMDLNNDGRTQTTSTSPNSVASLQQHQQQQHPYPSLTNPPPSFAYAAAPMHPHQVLPPSMGQAPMYPLQPAVGPPPHQTHQPMPQLAQSQQVQPMPANANPNASKPPGKKNQYPCPLSKEYNCHNFFTTSGHAARHAKKHTGKKDAFCPECNKSFTRKDNMEQHRRTHQNGRNASKPANNGAASSATGSSTADGAPATKRQKTSSTSSPSVKQVQSKPSKPANIQPAISSHRDASPSLLDPNLAISPASSFSFPDSSAGLGLPVQLSNQVYPDLLNQTAFGNQALPYPQGPYYDSSNMSGLDKLAMAATGERSRSNSS